MNWECWRYHSAVSVVDKGMGREGGREGEREEGERERERGSNLYNYVGGYSAIGWNHPGFADSTVSFVINVHITSLHTTKSTLAVLLMYS